jgi:hypothetical protein
MSDEQSDYQQTFSDVIEKLILAGWIEASARRGDLTAFSLRPDARICIRRLRDFIIAFGPDGIPLDRQWMFFKMLSDDTFSDGDVPHDP